MQIPLAEDEGFSLYFVSFVWRQLEFAFFGAVTPVAALFVFFTEKTNKFKEKKEMKKVLSIVALMLVIVCLLASCDTVKGMIIKHTVSFDLNGGVAGGGYTESIEIGDGKTLTLSTPTREGYSFLGWYSGENKIAEDTPITSDLSLIAKWEIKSFTVSFVDYFGNTVSTQTVKWGEAATAPSVDGIINNQRFDSWSADFSKVVEDMTVNAVYVENTYNITYSLGDKGEAFTKPCFYGEIPKIPEAPELDGYVFTGWFLDEELTERYFFDYKLDRDITLYAKFYDTSLGEYIVISNVEQLMAISEQPDAKYLLACDINCKGEQLTPIDEFSGELEGNGYKIYNFEISIVNTVSYKCQYGAWISKNYGSVINVSFEDYIYNYIATGIDTHQGKYIAVICAANYGIIQNCHINDGLLNFHVEPYGHNTYIGSITGANFSIIKDCSSSSDINGKAFNYLGDYAYVSTLIGGIAGYNYTENAVIENCSYFGEMTVTPYTNYNTYHRFYIGGVSGENKQGKITTSFSIGKINVEVGDNGSSATSVISVGGLVGYSDVGEIRNCYSISDMNVKYSNLWDGSYNDKVESVIIGGFAGVNLGKISNCYSDSKITNELPNAIDHWIGGFIGKNESSDTFVGTINKCFAVGNIVLSNVPENSGYFAGLCTGTGKDCYYLDTMTINLVTKTEVTESETTETIETLEPVEPSCTVGEAKTYAELTSVDFIENTLYFDRMIWFVTEGKLPTLR